MKRGRTTNWNSKPIPNKVLLISGSNDECCIVCGMSEKDSSLNPELLNWHGCNCGRWYHANCTNILGDTPTDFSCHKVKPKYGVTCTVRRPKDIGKRCSFLPPHKKEDVPAPVSVQVPTSHVSDCEPLQLANTFKTMELQDNDLKIRSEVSGGIKKNQNIEMKANPRPSEINSDINLTPLEKNIRNTKSQDVRGQNCIPPGKIGYDWNPWVAFKLAEDCDFDSDAEYEPSSFKEDTCKQKLQKTYRKPEKEEDTRDVHAESGSSMQISNETIPSIVTRESFGRSSGKGGIGEKNDVFGQARGGVDFGSDAYEGGGDQSISESRSKIDLVIDSVIKSSEGMNCKVVKTVPMFEQKKRSNFKFKKVIRKNTSSDTKKVDDIMVGDNFSGYVPKNGSDQTLKSFVPTNKQGSPTCDFDIINPGPSGGGFVTPVMSRNNSNMNEFCTPIRLQQEEAGISDTNENPTPKKFANKGLRTNQKRILPAKSIADVLKHLDKKAYAQYCLERSPVEDLPTVKRKKQGPTFPTAEEIENGAKEYDVPDYRAYGRRAPTIVTKVKELVMGAKCADAVIDIIPNFESKSTRVERLTFISKNYFKAADSSGGQLEDVELPTPVRASSIELPENILRPKGPIPEQDTGALERLEKDVGCEICGREYGSKEDNELADFLLGCWADRLCSSSKMYHLGCYFPQARVICDYDKPEEVHKFRSLVFCSRTCMLLANKRDAVDEEGLKLGKGRRKKINENED